MKLPGPASLLLALVVSLTVSSLSCSAASATSPQAVPGKEEPEGHIQGLAIARPKGGFLGLRLVDNRFVLTFYDAKKHPVAPDVARAALRWNVHYQPAPERTVLNPGPDAFSLSALKIVRPPHDFKLYISLLVASSDDAVESYNLDFHD